MKATVPPREDARRSRHPREADGAVRATGPARHLRRRPAVLMVRCSWLRRWRVRKSEITSATYWSAIGQPVIALVEPTGVEPATS